ncbi:Metabotropic glutamate receptor 5, partial [Toxocara canis]
IGALFPLHHQIAGTEGCGQIWEQYGIQRTEIALSTVAELNNHLPFKLGISIRDSCWTERIAMEQTIAFLREGVAQCSCCQTPGCQKKTSPVVAIVGPAKSSTTIAVQNLLQVFRIPQIGYGATTTDLSDKEQFSYYMRVVPSDAWQAKTIVTILTHFKWTYVAVVYSAGNYGEKGFEELERLKSDDVCIAYSEKVKSLAEPAEFDKILNSLRSQKSRPQVVVCFCEGRTMHEMFKAQKRLRLADPTMQPFQWIGSDGWADRFDVVDGVEYEAAGSFSIRIHSPNVDWFDDYYFSLNPHTNVLNPWFREFWQEKFKCQFTVPKDDLVTRVCTGNENLTVNYKQDAKLSQVVNSIRVVGYALQAMYNDRCRDNTTICTEMLAINGTLLYRYMINVTFVDQFQQEMYFDNNGDPPAWYDVLNYVGGSDGFRMVGDFRKKRGGDYRLEIFVNDIMFFDKSSKVPESVCSKPCGIGQRQRETIACCWICENCLQHQIVNYTTNHCQNCTLGSWPDDNRTSCHPLPHEAPSWSSTGIALALVLASAGIVTTLLTILVFVRHNHTPVVKSTTRELSYIILSGIMACYAISFAILARPSFASCFLTRTVPPIAFSIIYSALLTKTNRIARILAGSKKRILTKKPRFLSTSSQVVITWILVGIECMIVAVGVMEEMPQAGFDPYYQPSRMVLVCSTTTFAFLSPFLWNLFLISLCTLYAVKTRNLPENFNEAKFIGFTMYCTLVVWTAFIVLHLGTTNKALTMSFSFSLSASVALILLFFPKLYIILFHPEKNVRASYTTTKLIRCHFGNSQGMDSKHVSVSKTRTSQQSVSSYPTRTASVHISQSPSQDASTQTDSANPSSKFARTFSILASKRGSKAMDDEVMQLIDSCRRYQDEKMHGSVSNLLLEEREDDEVGSLLAGSIENSMRTVLSTVTRRPTTEPTAHTDDGFERLLKSRGVQPVQFTIATPL